MKIRFLFGAISLVLTSLVTSAQQPETAPAILHVSSIHKATDAEKTYHTAFGMQFIEGTIGNGPAVRSSPKSWSISVQLPRAASARRPTSCWWARLPAEPRPATQSSTVSSRLAPTGSRLPSPSTVLTYPNSKCST